jgi:ATP-dependent DNA helicase RecG
LAKYIERMGTGTQDMITRCREAGLPEPEFRVTDGFVTTIRRKTREVTPEVRLARVLVGEMTRRELQQALDLRHDEHFRLAYLLPALAAGLIEMTIPDKPTSRLQKYRLTDKGRAVTATRKS